MDQNQNNPAPQKGTEMEYIDISSGAKKGHKGLVITLVCLGVAAVLAAGAFSACAITRSSSAKKRWRHTWTAARFMTA